MPPAQLRVVHPGPEVVPACAGFSSVFSLLTSTKTIVQRTLIAPKIRLFFLLIELLIEVFFQVSGYFQLKEKRDINPRKQNSTVPAGIALLLAPRAVPSVVLPSHMFCGTLPFSFDWIGF